MNYIVKSSSTSNGNATITVKQSKIDFGITAESSETLANPAELFLGSFSACILKNVERFSHLMKFKYSEAEVAVGGTRLDQPPRMDEIKYKLSIYSDDTFNVELLQKNIEKFGTIFNTVKSSCTVSGEIKQFADSKR